MKVLFIDVVHEILANRLADAGYECVDGTIWSREKCMQQLPTFIGIVIRSRFPIDKTFLERATQLKFIARSGAGLENIDLSFAQQKGIQCYNAPEGNRNAVGEHALSMLLSLFNNIPKGDAEVRKGIWNREGNRGIELDGKTVGLIGYGNNGNAFAKKLSGFNVTVLAYDKYKTDYSDQYAKEATMQELFKEVDILSFHIPQTEETLQMVGVEFLSQFKKPIYLINLARGKIIQTKALLKAIKEQKVAGACLDVLEYESSSFEQTLSGTSQLEFRELLTLPNVLFSPHIGGWTKESYFKLSDVLADKILGINKQY